MDINLFLTPSETPKLSENIQQFFYDITKWDINTQVILHWVIANLYRYHTTPVTISFNSQEWADNFKTFLSMVFGYGNMFDIFLLADDWIESLPNPMSFTQRELEDYLAYILITE